MQSVKPKETPMKTISMMAVALAILAQATLAHAILPFQSVRKQVYAEAKADGVFKYLKNPSLRLNYSKSGKTVTASVYAMGAQWPTFKQTRMLQSTAKFRLTNLIDGTLAKPMKQSGQVWQTVYRME
jgi:hypothetical protein